MMHRIIGELAYWAIVILLVFTVLALLYLLVAENFQIPVICPPC